jgi:hypothetical protein
MTFSPLLIPAALVLGAGFFFGYVFGTWREACDWRAWATRGEKASGGRLYRIRQIWPQQPRGARP